jgi:hypothetical protein
MSPDGKLRQGHGFKSTKLRLQTVLIRYTHLAMLLIVQPLTMLLHGVGRCSRSGRQQRATAETEDQPKDPKLDAGNRR